ANIIQHFIRLDGSSKKQLDKRTLFFPRYHQMDVVRRLMWEKMGEALYPEGHPYSWQTIGYVSDLDRVDVNDLKAFFLRWYGPNNAVLTIGGDL
ncbi:hypothetical protein, partial [Vibrio cholerae]|uniref:hypothetical protein n=1 Tax=Vibrio cholerae TaxID=666 RepID=UPI001F0A3342